MYWRMFDAAWFARHQRTLLALVNAPVLGRWLRWVLCITRHDIGYRSRITRLLPHAYEVRNPDGSRTLDVRTHPKYAKRIYYGFAWLWWALHVWDQVIANPLIPALNAGFDALTAYPDPGSSSTTTDEWVDRQGVDESLATIRAGAGVAEGDNDSFLYVWLQSSATASQFARCLRSVFTFDTSAAGANISDATLSLWGDDKTNGIGSIGLHVASATPASNSNIAPSDFANVGSTSFASVTYASFDATNTTYTDLALNASGLAGLTPGGISALCVRSDWDLNNSFTGSWTATAISYLRFRAADTAGTSNDPKLVVTFTPQARNRVTLNQNRISAVANFTNSASTSLAFSSAVSAGQLLTLTFTSGSSNGSSGVQLSTVNDSVNSTGRWQRAVRQRSTAAASSLGAEIWYLAGSSAGTPTVTLTLASTAAGRFLYGIQSWSNASTNATDVLGTVVSTAANSSLCALPTMSSLSSGSVLVTVYKTLAGVTNRTNPSGWSTLAPQNSTRENSFYLAKTDTTASTATWTITAASQYVVVGAEFRGSTFTPSTVASRKGDGCGMLRMGVC